MLSQLKPKLENWIASDQKIKKLGVSLHYYLFRHRLWEKVWALDNKSIFTEIYRNNLWNNEESRSGGGSTLKHTARLRSGLQDLLHNNGIRSVFDAGCGDFNWMKTIRLDGIKYLGGDIVRELVADNNKKYGSPHTSFVEWDVTRDKPPIVDLIFCREVLLHLSFHDARSAIINFKKSQSQYLLITHYPFVTANTDIRTGQCRGINFRLPPFSFPAPLLTIEENYSPQCMALWKLADIGNGKQI